MDNAGFWNLYGEAALTSLGYFWQALWAFVLGYVVSSMIQVFVTSDRMEKSMGDAGKGSIALATFFGFISSSCSFAALATAKSLFKKGAGFMPALAFLLSSTNLVIELGIIITVFLSWQFVVGEYVGGILLILFSWLVYKITRPKEMIRKARRRLHNQEGSDDESNADVDWKERIKSIDGWRKVAKQYFMEWGMVWKDVTVGFTIAGIIAVFVPPAFFQTLFIGAGQGNANPGFFAVLENVLVAPIAAFFTFIGSMGNIPLAAVLYGNGVSFGGVMAFIFSDLIVFPVIRVNAKYYGWKMALYIVGLLLASLVATSLVLHYAFALFGILPQSSGGGGGQSDRFAIDYTFFLNLIFLAISGALAWLRFRSKKKKKKGHDMDMDMNTDMDMDMDMDMGSDDQSVVEKILFWLALAAYLWLAGGLLAAFFSA